MHVLVLLCFIGHSVLGQQRLPGRFRDEDLDSFSVTLHPKSQKVVEGRPVVLTCISSLRTNTHFKWMLGLKPLIPDYEGGHESRKEGVHVHQTADNISVLRIDSVNTKEHKRKISCEATAEAGVSGGAQTSIKIFRKGRRRKGFPVLQSYTESLAVYRPLDRLTLTCTANIGPESREAPEWRWIKNGTWDLSLYEEMEERIEISDSGTLEIFALKESDAGTYECVAENRRGSAYSPPIEVIIEPEDLPSQRPCEDHNFQLVPHGSIYQPYPDPCMECECVDGEKRYCTTVMCDEPPCRNYELVDGTCCGFRCLEDDTIDVWTSEGDGTCVPYIGTGCKEFLKGRNVYMRPQESQDSVENKLKMLFRGAQSLSVNCMEYILPFLCFHTVPLCDVDADKPRGRHVCREDCEMVADMCQDEFIVFRDQYINGTAVLPQCTQLPAKDSGDENCISFEDFLDTGRSTEIEREGIYVPGRELPDGVGIPRRESNSDGAPCVDRYGKLVNDGDLFLPEKDPCLACICDDGSRIMCTVVACEPPPCRNYEKLNDSCCGYICKEDGNTERHSLGGTCRAFDGSVVSEGEQFQPNSDPCHQCHCISGEERNCRTISCDPPKDCPNHRAVPGLCCAFTCEERVVDPDFIRKDRKEPCIANNGSYVLNGEYQPGSDPCMICRCLNGRKLVCRTVMCIPPKCPKVSPNPVPVPGSCCEFKCHSDETRTEGEEIGALPAEPCIANNGTYILNGDYQPGSDPCTTCRCVNGKKEICSSVGCVPPDCPNPIAVPGACCKFICREPFKPDEGYRPFPSEPCIANNGSHIMNGRFHPGGDLCTTCICVNGSKQACMSVGCYPPQCPNRVHVPGTCCEFRCEEPSMSNRLDLMSPQAPGSLSVQQVGPKSAIVQWKMDKEWKVQNHSKLTLHYNCTMNSTLTNMTIPADMTYIVLSDLHLNEQYQFILLSTLPEERVVLDAVSFTLNGRAGQTLFLGDVSNGNVYESRGRNSGTGYRFSQIRNRNSTHIMLNSFHRIEMKKATSPPCQTGTGCNVMQFSLYNDDGYLVPVLALMFDDERDFKWAKAHL